MVPHFIVNRFFLAQNLIDFLEDRSPCIVKSIFRIDLKAAPFYCESITF